MKNIFFDLDTNVLLSKDGRTRPFMDIILAYCEFSKIQVSLMISPGDVKKRAPQFYEGYVANDNSYIAACTLWAKGGAIPSYPDLVISCDGDYLKKYPGLVVPPYNPDKSNKFADLAFAGTLIESIKNKVVLNRHAPEKQVAPEKQPDMNDGEDFSNWAVSI